MLITFTDFGPQGLYLGQIECVLHQQAAGVPIVHLLNDAPAQRPDLVAHLLAALVPQIPVHSVCLCVVDPGVGGARQAVALFADDRWYVGPDNGLMSVVAARAKKHQWYKIIWQPEVLSASFHGRDVFAPVAAELVAGQTSKIQRIEAPDVTGCEADLAKIIYIDHYGNLMTGIRYREEFRGRQLSCGGHLAKQARTFGDVQEGEVFWYANSLGLIELAANQGSAMEGIGVALNTDIEWDAK